jgi:hypothetical protein
MMSRQLTLLRTRFHLKPNIVIAIVDQTDIGDTVCRYGAYLGGASPKGETKALKLATPDRIEMNRNILSDAPSLLKLIRHAWLNLQDYIHESRDTGRWDCIAAPLENGISGTARNAFIATLSEYADEILRDSEVRKVYFVTHPHAKNLSGEYEGNVASIISDFIARHPRKAKFCHIDFGAEFATLYKSFGPGHVFLTTDPASHLTDAAYLEVYFPRILNAALDDKC